MQGFKDDSGEPAKEGIPASPMHSTNLIAAAGTKRSDIALREHGIVTPDVWRESRIERRAVCHPTHDPGQQLVDRRDRYQPKGPVPSSSKKMPTPI